MSYSTLLSTEIINWNTGIQYSSGIPKASRSVGSAILGAIEATLEMVTFDIPVTTSIPKTKESVVLHSFSRNAVN